MRSASASAQGHNQYSPLISRDLITGKESEKKEWSGRTKTKEEFIEFTNKRKKGKEVKVEPEAKMLWIGIPNVCKNADDKIKLES